MSAGSSPTSLHIRAARVFTFSPSPQRRDQYFNFSPKAVKISSPPVSPKSDRDGKLLERKTEERALSPMETVIKNAFISDFDQHCKRIVPISEAFLTFNQFEELLVDLHFVSSLATRNDISKVLLVKMWKFVRDPESGLASKEITKRVLLEVVGIEKIGLNMDIQQEFRSFAVARLRYLHLQEHAITQDPVLRPRTLNSQPNRPSAIPASQGDSIDKENSTLSPRSKPPVAMSPSPLRIPQTKTPFATVKVNLTPYKFDVINVFEGDEVETLARKFVEKHSLGRDALMKLCGLLETKLAAFRPSV